MILDTDILIDLIRRKPEAVAWWNSLDAPPAIAGFAAMELTYGAQNRIEQKMVGEFLAPFLMVWPIEADLLHALRVFIPLRLTQGHDILDSVIAATALGLGEPVATFNVRHYSKLPGVTTVQPYTRT